MQPAAAATHGASFGHVIGTLPASPSSCGSLTRARTNASKRFSPLFHDVLFRTLPGRHVSHTSRVDESATYCHLTATKRGHLREGEGGKRDDLAAQAQNFSRDEHQWITRERRLSNGTISPDARCNRDGSPLDRAASQRTLLMIPTTCTISPKTNQKNSSLRTR